MNVLQLRDDDVLTFSLGVGPGIDRTELEQISGDPNRTFQAIDYDQLNVITDQLAHEVLGTCKKSSKFVIVMTVIFRTSFHDLFMYPSQPRVKSLLV